MATLKERLSGQGFGGGEPPATAPPAGEESEYLWSPCFSARKELGATTRIDFRSADGHCISLPYHSLVDIAFIPDVEQDLEWIKFDYTPYWTVAIAGINLSKIYTLLQTHSVTWLRQGDIAEKNDSEPFIGFLEFTKMTDPAVTLAALQYQQRNLLGEPHEEEES